jgi:hypothetical protein
MLTNMGIPGWLTAPAMFALTPFCVPIKESGERHLYAATSDVYTPKARAGAANGSTGINVGSYLMEWDNRPVGNEMVLEKYRTEGVAEKVWKHTLSVYETVCEEGKKW